MAEGFSRRGFVRGAAAVGAGAWRLPANAQPARHRRIEVSDQAATPAGLESYKKAIRAMLALPPGDPRNWYRNAFVHVFDCPHGNWWFLPWHRSYLGWFERTCRELSGDPEFALPYWDWTKTPKIPAAMFDDVLDPDATAFMGSFADFKAKFTAPVSAAFAKFSPVQRDGLAHRDPADAAAFWSTVQRMFFDRPHARALTPSDPDLDTTTRVAVALPMVRSALRSTAFAGSQAGKDAAGFASAQAAGHGHGSRKGILESQPHDNVHGALGGPDGMAFMVSFLSPTDPIFFLHHANIDRLWDVWTRRQLALHRPALPVGKDLAAWSKEQFLFFSDEKGDPVRKTSAGDYASMDAFEYTYAPGSGESEATPAPQVASAAPALRSFPARLASAKVGSGQSAKASFVPPANLAAEASNVASQEPAVAEITLNLSQADEGRRFRILLSPPGGAPVEAGAITVFGHHGATGPTTFTVALPDSVSGAGPNAHFDIQVIPFDRPKLSARRSGTSFASAPSAVAVAGITVRIP